MTIRIFIAVEVGPLDELIKFEDEIARTGAEVKLVEPVNIHITLKFLGDTAEDQLKTIFEIIRECSTGVKKFNLKLNGAGVFPNLNYIKIIWVGLEKFEPLEKISNCLNSKLNKLGFKSEKRAFRPHITLGRVKSRKNKAELRELVINNKDREFGELDIEYVYLKKSVLDSKGPIYTTLDKIELE